jgi:hypothetical protein
LLGLLPDNKIHGQCYLEVFGILGTLQEYFHQREARLPKSLNSTPTNVSYQPWYKDKEDHQVSDEGDYSFLQNDLDERFP